MKLTLLVLALLVQLVIGVSVWTTTLDKSKLLQRDADLSPTSGNSNEYTKVTVNSQTYQEMYGFGGALTESSAINFLKLKSANPTRYQQTLKSLFDPSSGAGFTMVRVPMGSSDFSMAPYYTYDEVANDWLFTQWSWKRDSTTTLPVLKDILAINPNIKVIIVPWTAPTWMKTSANASNAFYWGTLDARYYDDFAYYFQFTIQKYQSEGISIYALAPQNEPQNEPNSYPVMRLDSTQEAAVAILIGKKLQANNINTKILILDHNWDLSQFVIDVFNSAASPYVAGVAWHCYAGAVDAQLQVYNAHPDKEVWFTECSGEGPSNFNSNIQWNTNNLYIGSVKNWARTVLLWNFALDDNNGPKTAGGCANCRGIVTVHGDNSITYNEEYYGMAMFSKFLKFPAHRVDCSLNGGYNCVTNICFKNADSSTVIVVANFCQTPQEMAVQNGNSYVKITVDVGLTSFVW